MGLEEGWWVRTVLLWASRGCIRAYERASGSGWSWYGPGEGCMGLGEGWWVRTVLLWARRGLYEFRRGLKLVNKFGNLNSML